MNLSAMGYINKPEIDRLFTRQKLSINIILDSLIPKKCNKNAV
jgi:hypothetical protein